MNRKPADKTYAYLLGCYFGDASVFKRGNTYAYSFECIDKEFIDKVFYYLDSTLIWIYHHDCRQTF